MLLDDQLTESRFIRTALNRARFRLCVIAIIGVLLAVCTGVYGVMAGPVLKFAVAQGHVSLPHWLSWFGLPTSVFGEDFLLLFPPVIIGAAVCKGVCGYWFVVGRTQFGHSVSRLLRERLFTRLEEAGPDEVEGVGKGELVSRFVYDIDIVEKLFADGIIRSSQAAIEVMVLFALCVTLDWQLACLFFLIYPAVLIPIFRLTRRLKNESKLSQASISTAANVIQDQLHAMRAIQSLHYPGVLRGRLHRAIDDMYTSALRAVKLKATASPLAEVMGAGALCLTVVVCGWRLSQGSVPPEASLSFIACLLLMYKPIKGIGELPQLLAPGRAALTRILRLDLGKTAPSGHTRGDVSHGVVLKEIGIQRGGSWVVRNVSFALSRNQFALISGPNGSGKSSLVEALLGIRSVNEGELRLGGVIADDVDIGHWRAQIGWLSQEQLLIQGSILENVIMGRDGFDVSDVVETWQSLGFDILMSPEVFFGRALKSEGTGLSGGERRKILLTRACLGAPPVLILDEPDAFQDAHGMQSVRDLIERVRKDRLLVVVSHDAQLAPLADIHLKLDGHQ